MFKCLIQIELYRLTKDELIRISTCEENDSRHSSCRRHMEDLTTMYGEYAKEIGIDIKAVKSLTPH